ncbi:MFS transporter [Verminephrobacter aporrectodeae subsp. tuberculatae]|uniref:MFS transporter n=1 Tax=Verminephrobacter aporrectodeae TaxID=1110389 RepID=UPI0022446BEC|nr:MFS transporter [Verminephrobacter aporrectodeae]MCW8206268.1 MFS transporter [Verminephrobacter aporrectodeae subsp. tuberculatae]
MPSTPALTPRRELWLLLTLAGVQFTHIVDFMIMMPLGPEFTQMFAISDAQFGLLVSAYTLSAGVSGLLASTCIDRFGRKRLLLVLYTLFGLATLACGLAPTYATLIAARILAGAFGGVLQALVQTIVADVVAFERRGRATGIVMTSFSVATVAGVPLGLVLAQFGGWHLPFIATAAMVGGVAVVAARTLPALTAHVHAARGRTVWGGIAQVLVDPNHRRAFVFTALLMFAGFTVIPYITIYMRSNIGVRADQVPLIYLCGGVATLFTARVFGGLTDRLGKVPTYRGLALALALPLLALTGALAHGAPLWTVLLVTTLMFTIMGGRMIPGMAIVASAAQPAVRGTFMTLNGSVQSASMGLASFVGGLLISRDAQGLVQNYWLAALVGVAASLLSALVVGRLHLHGAGPSAR